MRKNIPINYQHRHVEEASLWALPLLVLGLALLLFYLFVVIPKVLEPTFVRIDKVRCSALAKPVKGCQR